MDKLSKSLVIVGGILYLAFGAFHSSFCKVFNSNNEFGLMKPFLSKVLHMLIFGMIVFFLSLGVYFNRILSRNWAC